MNGIQEAQTCEGVQNVNPIIGTGKEKPCPSGIYQIANNVNGKIYIGSAVNLHGRFLCHLSLLKRGKHHSRHLQHAADLYGLKHFVFMVLEDVPDVKQLLTRENYYFETMKPQYNMTPVAGSSLGIKRSAETRRKISEAEKGKQKWLGKKHHPESREKMRQAKKGKRLGETNHNSKLTVPQVLEIKKRLTNEKRGQAKIARDYGVTPTLISNIKADKTWSHIKGPVIPTIPKARLTATQVIEILKRLAKGEVQAQIARDYGVCRQQIGHINTGKTWKHIPRPGVTYN